MSQSDHDDVRGDRSWLELLFISSSVAVCMYWTSTKYDQPRFGQASHLHSTTTIPRTPRLDRHGHGMARFGSDAGCENRQISNNCFPILLPGPVFVPDLARHQLLIPSRILLPLFYQDRDIDRLAVYIRQMAA